LQALAIGAAQVGATGAQHVGAAGAQHVGAGAQHDARGAQQLDRQHLGLQHLNRFRLQHLGRQQLLAGAQQLDAAGAQQVDAAGAQQLTAAGAQQVLAGAQQPLSACATALAQQNNTAAVRVVHFIISFSWKGVCRSGTEANPGNPAGKSRFAVRMHGTSPSANMAAWVSQQVFSSRFVEEHYGKVLATTTELVRGPVIPKNPGFWVSLAGQKRRVPNRTYNRTLCQKCRLQRT